MDQPTLVAFLAFGAAILGVEAIYWIVFRTREAKKAVNRRLALSGGRYSQPEVLEIMRRERGFANFQSSALTGFNDYLVQTGVRLSWTSLALWTVLIAVVIAAVGSLFTFKLWIPITLGVIGAPLLLFLYLKFQRYKRIARFGAQLPDAIDVIVRGLRVGHPLSKALDLVAKEMPDPIGSECGMTGDEMAFGQDFVTAVNNLYRRVGQEDLLFLVIAVTVQSQTGGNLAEVLGRLSRLVRGRATLRLKVRALSAEGRMSAYFLTAMPFILYGIIQLISPNFFAELWSSPIEIPVFVYAFSSLLIANYSIYKMVNFKV